jgi:hypothetical protein
MALRQPEFGRDVAESLSENSAAFAACQFSPKNPTNAEGFALCR